MKQQIAAQPPIKRRASAYTAGRSIPEPTTQQHIFVEPKRKPSLVPYFLLGVVIVLVGLIVWSWVVMPWWANVTDQWQAGGGRITRFEADVGHGGTSTFLAFELNAQVIVIEIPGADMAKAKQYRSATLLGDGNTHRVIMLSTATVDGIAHCLIVHVEGRNEDIVMYNTGTDFSFKKPSN